MKIIRWIAIIVLVAGIGLAGYWFRRRHASHAGNGAGAGNTNVVAQVRLAPVKQSTLSQTTTAYGSIIARPGKAHSVFRVV